MKLVLQACIFLLVVVAGVLADQASELQNFYTATHGDKWRNKTQWLKGDPCVDGWHGIACDVNGNVVQIDLMENHLEGTLPASLALPTLNIFRVDGNPLLTGEVPNYSNMNLVEIYLNATGLTGAFPAWFANVPSLLAISLAGSNLTGAFPTAWCNMPQLKLLSMGEQNLTGGLPNCIGSMTNLTYLDITSSSLGGTIPNSISSLQNLKYLTLVNNSINGDLPESLSSLSSLVELRLRYNNFEGTIPASYAGLSNMVYLSLSSNYLNGTIPDWLGDRATLFYIDLRCNDFNDPIPVWLQNQPDANVLFACNPNITTLPDWCLTNSNCGSKGCEGTRCDAQPDGNQGPNKAVIIVLACFLGLVLVGNVMLMVFLIRRKCMRYDHTAEMKPILSPRTRMRNDTRKEREEEFH